MSAWTLTTTPVNVHEIKVIPGMSDHEAVTAMCDTNIETNKKRPRVVHIYTRANTDGIEEDHKTFFNDFHASCESKSTSENWTLFKDTLTSTMTKYITTKTISGR